LTRGTVGHAPLVRTIVRVIGIALAVVGGIAIARGGVAYGVVMIGLGVVVATAGAGLFGGVELRNGSNAAAEAIATDLDSPVWIVTAGEGQERSGCLVGFATQCSIDPDRWLVCISKANHTARPAARTDVLVVHLLRAGDRGLAVRFGEESGDEVDKFAGLRWHPGPAGAPVVDGLDWFAGQVLARHDVGDHIAVLLAPFDGSCEHHDRQLGFQAVRDLDAGHAA
jgi:flavin reductase (DIM6/NTAB) family NADH-FMN oxidoreductase RutF